jgi:hypothetical protein
MFNLFKKRSKQDSMFDNERWAVGMIEYDGYPIILRINTGLKPFVGTSDHTLRISFAMPFKHANPGGMPDIEENMLFDQFEERILAVLKSRGSVVQAITITTGTAKEHVFYAQPELDVKAAHEQLMQEITSHELQCIADIEEDWATYKTWSNM